MPRIPLTLPVDMYETLRKLAYETHTSMAEHIRAAITEYLKSKEESPVKKDYQILTEGQHDVECTVYASNGDTTCWVWSIDHETGHETFDTPEAALADLKWWVGYDNTELSDENIQQILDYQIKD